MTESIFCGKDTIFLLEVYDLLRWQARILELNLSDSFELWLETVWLLYIEASGDVHGYYQFQGARGRIG